MRKKRNKILCVFLKIRLTARSDPIGNTFLLVFDIPCANMKSFKSQTVLMAHIFVDQSLSYVLIMAINGAGIFE